MCWKVIGFWLRDEKGETLTEKRRQYLDSKMCEVSDDECWRHVHCGPPLHDDVDEPNETAEESDQASNATLHTADFSPEVLQTMRDTNTLLRSRIVRLETEWNDAQMANDLDSMGRIEDQIREATALMYSI